MNHIPLPICFWLGWLDRVLLTVLDVEHLGNPSRSLTIGGHVIIPVPKVEEVVDLDFLACLSFSHCTLSNIHIGILRVEDFRVFEVVKLLLSFAVCKPSFVKLLCSIQGITLWGRHALLLSKHVLNQSLDHRILVLLGHLDVSPDSINLSRDVGLGSILLVPLSGLLTNKSNQLSRNQSVESVEVSNFHGTHVVNEGVHALLNKMRLKVIV